MDLLDHGPVADQDVFLVDHLDAREHDRVFVLPPERQLVEVG